MAKYAGTDVLTRARLTQLSRLGHHHFPKHQIHSWLSRQVSVKDLQKAQ